MTTTLFGGEEWPKPKPVTYCVHRMVPVLMPDGVTFYASGHHSSRDEDEMRPDYGFYLDSIWHPDCIAFYTHWQDFGVPTLELETFVEMLDLVHAYAKEYAVEVGCIGGHGRTGTALACFAVVGGAEPETAIRLIRESYCKKAVETEQQEWLVFAVHAVLHNLEVPEMPEPPPPPPIKYGGLATTYQHVDWSQGQCKIGEHKGKEAKVNIDANGQEYCSQRLVDIPSFDTKICTWCEATLKSGAK